MLQYCAKQLTCQCLLRREHPHEPEKSFFSPIFPLLLSLTLKKQQSNTRFIFPKHNKQLNAYRAKNTFHLGLLALFFCHQKFNNLCKELV